MNTKELTVVVESLRAEIAALNARIEVLEAAPMRVKASVAPRPLSDDTGRVARSAAISRLAERFPERKSFTSIEVMDEMAAVA